MTSTVSGASVAEPLKIAILAMGGQGGGVLADWLVDLAERADWYAQSTSVPGVAQRTGATIYYVELFPPPWSMEQPPVLAQMPTPGDVDVVISAELMEAGRAILRGIVTPDRTTLLTSTHRSYAISEKSHPSNGIVDAAQVMAAGNDTAKQFYAADLQRIAESCGSVISASLFGALAATDVLPFAREQFEETIRTGNVGVTSSLSAFDAGWTEIRSAQLQRSTKSANERFPALPQKAATAGGQIVLDNLRSRFPDVLQPVILAGVRHLVDFQDSDYANAYLSRIERILSLDSAADGPLRGWALTWQFARYLATAMAYDDVIKVADLKIRDARVLRISKEVRLEQGQMLDVADYMHPRFEEVCGTMPERLGRWMEQSFLRNWTAALFRKGRHIKTSHLGGYLLLYALASRRSKRTATLRHAQEIESIDQWTKKIEAALETDYEFALAVVKSRRLVKGYSDTHARSSGRFSQLMMAADALCGRQDAAAKYKTLYDAALNDVKGERLKAALAAMPTV
ncbi:MAG: indolepyruvate oxidoreductase subunit beta family protein [Advenella sp.]|uniref:Uncharacterized protein n=1 Tax=Advenella kashmirensis TaxID=310575 RepID=A0A356LD82_9BURK|nr:indolepyruvate oxidoreductase subunit beta family protein [Advenella sp. FME57]HBP28960.1 hypothetical protein [Advenella kashmirensis]